MTQDRWSVVVKNPRLSKQSLVKFSFPKARPGQDFYFVFVLRVNKWIFSRTGNHERLSLGCQLQVASELDSVKLRLGLYTLYMWLPQAFFPYITFFERFEAYDAERNFDLSGGVGEFICRMPRETVP